MASIKQIQQLKQIDSSKTYLVLISPETIPHLIIIYKGLYYSLTYKKAVLGEPFEAYFNFLKRTKRKLIFLELAISESDPKFIFNKFSKVDTDKITCLAPITEYTIPESKAEFVFELIPELYDADKINAAFHLNLEKKLSRYNEFDLVEYTKEAIFSYIQTLNDKHAKRS